MAEWRTESQDRVDKSESQLFQCFGNAQQADYYLVFQLWLAAIFLHSSD